METKTCAPLGNFIDLMLDAICVVDAEGRFVFVSAACERIFGYAPEEMIGKPMIELVLPEDRPRTLQTASQIMAGQPKPHFENRYVRKDGQVVHIMWSARWSEREQVRVAVARDVTELKQAAAMQAALYAISEAAHAAEDMMALFRRIHRIIGELLPANNFSVALYDAVHDQLSFPYHVDVQEPSPVVRKPAAGTLCAEVIRSGQPLLLTPETLEGFPAHLRQIVGRKSLCWLGVPLNSSKGTIGALVLKSYCGGVRYGEKDKELLQFVSNQIATAIERHQLHARLRYMAQYDELTGLPNRGLLFDRLHTALARARREQGRLALLYLDLDKFKQVNDTHGHEAGDRALQLFARLLGDTCRSGDLVGRLGGEEFGVLLLHNSEPAGLALDRRLRRRLHAASVAELGFALDYSAGMAVLQPGEAALAELMARADGALYEAKTAGRGRLMSAS